MRAHVYAEDKWGRTWAQALTGLNAERPLDRAREFAFEDKVIMRACIMDDANDFWWNWEREK